MFFSVHIQVIVKKETGGGPFQEVADFHLAQKLVQANLKLQLGLKHFNSFLPFLLRFNHKVRINWNPVFPADDALFQVDELNKSNMNLKGLDAAEENGAARIHKLGIDVHLISWCRARFHKLKANVGNHFLEIDNKKKG